MRFDSERDGVNGNTPVVPSAFDRFKINEGAVGIAMKVFSAHPPLFESHSFAPLYKAVIHTCLINGVVPSRL
jgi:hypothetical protein